MKKLLVFDSHPVQYRVPIWQEINKVIPGSVEVAYASDCSVKGFADKEFGKNIAWDEPLLSGYEYFILHSEKGVPLSGWSSLTGKGVDETLDREEPDVVLLTGLNYRYDWAVYHAARKRNIPVWLRCETQDMATPKSILKKLVRFVIYKYFYNGISLFFYIGELNKQHYLSLGIPERKLRPALYGTVFRYKGMSVEDKWQKRTRLRSEEGIEDDAIVIGFSGKFIYKKNPGILYQMLKFIPAHLQNKLVLYFIGSGEQEEELKNAAAEAENSYGVKSIFKGFVNQSKIGDHYLAMDILVLPSRQMGETWGLVVNEALQAGCGVVVSEFVGSSRNFNGLERFRIFSNENAKELALKITELALYQRDFNWALNDLDRYSIETIASKILEELK